MTLASRHVKYRAECVGLLSIKSIYFFQELYTDIALNGVPITLSLDKVTFLGNSLHKETVSWKYEVTVQKYAQH